MEEEIQDFLLKQAHMVHFGSVSLTAEPARGSVLSAIRRARSYGAVITYDPNYRARLWDDPLEAIIVMRQPLPLVDILKVSEEELPLLSGSEDWEEGSRCLMEKGISLILVTLGEAGCFYRLGHLTGASTASLRKSSIRMGRETRFSVRPFPSFAVKSSAVFRRSAWKTSLSLQTVRPAFRRPEPVRSLRCLDWENWSD